MSRKENEARERDKGGDTWNSARWGRANSSPNPAALQVARKAPKVLIAVHYSRAGCSV